MRTIGVIILAGSLLIGCKTSSVAPSASTAYEEDLSVWRPAFETQKEETSDTTMSVDNADIVFTNHIKSELDSVNQIIVNQNRSQRYVDGYTIQIYTGNDREAANDARTKAILFDGSLEPKMTYHQPSYRVKVGQYTDRLEAHKVFESLKDEFPLALLIPERILIDYD